MIAAPTSGALTSVSTMTQWEEYDAWNDALGRHFFSPEFADLPVYLDVDAEAFGAAADELGVERSGAPSALAQAVQHTISEPGGVIQFAGHTSRFTKWRRSLTPANAVSKKGDVVELAPPPIVALLTTCVLAAERMGADPTLPSHAYYPRLGEVLGLGAKETESLKRSFPITEWFWRGVNEYLEASEGRLGLPTAYALGHRYVGIPQSQAMVRAVDRAKLPEFFDEFGLVPGAEMVPADLERLLDSWISQTPSPVSNQLGRLWKRGAARERVAGVVAVELSHWDGSYRRGSDPGSRGRGGLELTALMRQGFGSKNVEFSFAARLPMNVDADELVITSADGTPSIGVVPAAGARLRPIPGSRLDPASLVGAVIELSESVSSQTVSRRPRRVVPLRRDELLGALVEVDRVQLADDTVVLIKDDEQLLKQATDLIEAFGRHGVLYRSTEIGGATSLHGLPDGWALLEDVQLFAIPQDVKRIDLHPLVPLATAQLSFAGGLKLPGRVRKWSSLRPPEIRAAVAEAESLTVSLYDLSGDDRLLLERWTEPSQAMVVALDDADLDDGDYDVELAVRAGKSAKEEVISQSTLRLRSADTPDALTWESATRLNYELDDPYRKVVSACAVSGESEIWVDGLRTVGERENELAEHPVLDGTRWDTKRTASETERPVVVLGTADQKSCVVTGAHRIQLPTWHGGKSTTSQIVGICSECGIRKAHPARPRWKQPGTAISTLPRIEFKNLQAHSDLRIDLTTCLDALIHVGGGAMNALERVASQAEGGALFLDNFVRTLESHGHIDVRRDETLQPVEWEANPPYLGETIINGFALAGAWSAKSRDALARHLPGRGGRLETIPDESGLSAWFVRGLDGNALEAALIDSGISADVIWNAPDVMLDAIPPLSEVEQSIPRVPIPHYSKATVFNVDRAKWVATPGVAVPGAYRIEQSFKTISIWVDAEGALDRTCRIGTVQLVKHLAALHARKSLLGYLPGQSKLLVPMGAELPALYGRAAVLCSGLSPSVSPATRTIGYHDVPRAIADKVNTLLMS